MKPNKFVPIRSALPLLFYLLLGPTPGLRADVPAIISYSGRLSVSSNLFTGTGQFKFALVDAGTTTSRGATATAYKDGEFITRIDITDGGQGYTSDRRI